MLLSRVTLLPFLVWISFLLYVYALLVRMQETNAQLTEKIGDFDGAEAVRKLITDANHDFQKLQRDNEELKRQLITALAILSSNKQPRKQPFKTAVAGHFSAKHEEYRRAVENGVMELWRYYSAELNKAKGDVKEVQGEEQFRFLQANLLQLVEVDGAEQWRAQKLKNLSNVVQSRLDELQNPLECEKKRRLLCTLEKHCGFGCQIHQAAYCFVLAYSTRRTLVLDTKNWRYGNWIAAFQPVSRTCSVEDGPAPGLYRSWEGESEKLVVALPPDDVSISSESLPLAFPKEFAPDLLQLHGNPPVWWMGQFVSYLMRYSTEMREQLNNYGKKIGFDGPVVGVHVRRTDKLTSEAKLHEIEEYMRWVEEYFEVLSHKKGGNKVPRKIFLATDDPKLISEAKAKYPNYEIFGNEDIAGAAEKMRSRYSDSSLRGLLIDLHFLSRSDFLVCTFSSQVCRVAYELMQVLRGDFASRFRSLDDHYYYGGQLKHQQIALLPHSPKTPEEISILHGDIIEVIGNHWNGWSKGKNTRTNKVGLYPTFKVKEKWRIAEFP